MNAQDVIYLQQQGVSPRVVQAMQQPPVHPVVYQQPQPVIVERVYDPYYGPYHRHGYYHRHCPPPGVSWGVTVRN